MQPLITDDADTQGSGSHQVEVSYSQDRTRWAGKTERVDSVPLAYTYGLTDTLDIFAMTDYSRIRVPGERTSGFCNTVIGLKWRFFENETSGTHLAIKPEVRLPVDSRREEKGLGTGKTSGVLTLILSQKLPFGAVHFNAGMGRDRFRYRHSIDNARNRHFSVAPVWEVSSQWTLAADIGVDLSRSNGDTVRSRFSEIAAIYSPGKNLDLAVGYIRKVGSEYSKTTTHNIIAGVTWRFPQRKISLD
ncbi:MAG: transporter [Azoarcus sp.]|nr:transporter [Azoarcus sp.]